MCKSIAGGFWKEYQRILVPAFIFYKRNPMPAESMDCSGLQHGEGMDCYDLQHGEGMECSSL